MKLSQAFELIRLEREYQTRKWGSIQDHPHAIPGYLLIAQAELNEAIAGWMKNRAGRNDALAEIVQVAAVCAACLEQHGVFNVVKHDLEQS